jgi:hypothetical protein
LIRARAIVLDEQTRRLIFRPGPIIELLRDLQKRNSLADVRCKNLAARAIYNQSSLFSVRNVAQTKNHERHQERVSEAPNWGLCGAAVSRDFPNYDDRHLGSCSRFIHFGIALCCEVFLG